MISLFPLLRSLTDIFSIAFLLYHSWYSIWVLYTFFCLLGVSLLCERLSRMWKHARNEKANAVTLYDTGLLDSSVGTAKRLGRLHGKNGAEPSDTGRLSGSHIDATPSHDDFMDERLVEGMLLSLQHAGGTHTEGGGTSTPDTGLSPSSTSSTLCNDKSTEYLHVVSSTEAKSFHWTGDTNSTADFSSIVSSYRNHNPGDRNSCRSSTCPAAESIKIKGQAALAKATVTRSGVVSTQREWLESSTLDKGDLHSRVGGYA